MASERAFRVPSYRPHKSGNARVTLGGRDFYLGPFGSPESRVEYERLVGEWLTAGRPVAQSIGHFPATTTNCIHVQTCHLRCEFGATVTQPFRFHRSQPASLLFIEPAHQ